jgi:hypothetical protein
VTRCNRLRLINLFILQVKRRNSNDVGKKNHWDIDEEPGGQDINQKTEKRAI